MLNRAETEGSAMEGVGFPSLTLLPGSPARSGGARHSHELSAKGKKAGHVRVFIAGDHTVCF